MAQRRALELRVGAFVVLGIVLLFVFIFAIGDLTSYFQPTYQLRVLFGSANGIIDGAPVQYAGVEVGRVHEVKIVQPPGWNRPAVEIVIRVPGKVKVYADDIASISTFGLLGEKYLEITPGPGEKHILDKNGQLVGKPPVSTEKIMERSHEVLAEFERTLEGLNSFVGDLEARVYMKEALQEARDATRHWKLVGERLNLLLTYAESGEGTVGKLMYTDELHAEVLGLVTDIRAHPWKLLAKPKKSAK